MKKSRHILRYAWTLALIAFAGFVLWEHWRNSAADIREVFREAQRSVIFILVAFQVGSWAADGLLARTLFAAAGFRIRLKDAMKVAVLEGIGIQLVPFIGGPATAYYGYRKLGVSQSALLFFMTAWVGIVWSTYFVFFAAALVLIPEKVFAIVSAQTLVFFGIFLAALLAFALWFFRKRHARFVAAVKACARAVNRCTRFLLRREFLRIEKAEHFSREIIDTFAVLFAQRGKFLMALFASAAFYFCDVGALYAAFIAFGAHPNPILVVLGFTIASVLPLLTLVPQTPGLMEASLVFTFSSFGLPPHIALLGTLLFRFITYWATLPLGALYWWEFRHRENGAEYAA